MNDENNVEELNFDVFIQFTFMFEKAKQNFQFNYELA